MTFYILNFTYLKLSSKLFFTNKYFLVAVTCNVSQNGEGILASWHYFKTYYNRFMDIRIEQKKDDAVALYDTSSYGLTLQLNHNTTNLVIQNMRMVSCLFVRTKRSFQLWNSKMDESSYKSAKNLGKENLVILAEPQLC